MQTFTTTGLKISGNKSDSVVNQNQYVWEEGRRGTLHTEYLYAAFLCMFVHDS